MYTRTINMRLQIKYNVFHDPTWIWRDQLCFLVVHVKTSGIYTQNGQYMLIESDRQVVKTRSNMIDK